MDRMQEIEQEIEQKEMDLQNAQSEALSLRRELEDAETLCEELEIGIDDLLEELQELADEWRRRRG